MRAALAGLSLPVFCTRNWLRTLRTARGSHPMSKMRVSTDLRIQKYWLFCFLIFYKASSSAHIVTLKSRVVSLFQFAQLIVPSPPHENIKQRPLSGWYNLKIFRKQFMLSAAQTKHVMPLLLYSSFFSALSLLPCAFLPFHI